MINRINRFFLLFLVTMVAYPAIGQDVSEILRKCRSNSMSQCVSMEIKQKYWDNIDDLAKYQAESTHYSLCGPTYIMKSENGQTIQDEETLVVVDDVEKTVDVYHAQVIPELAAYAKLIADSLHLFANDLSLIERTNYWTIKFKPSFSMDVLDAELELDIRKSDYELLRLTVISQNNISSYYEKEASFPKSKFVMEFNSIARSESISIVPTSSIIIEAYDKIELHPDFIGYTLLNHKYTVR